MSQKRARSQTQGVLRTKLAQNHHISALAMMF